MLGRSLSRFSIKGTNRHAFRRFSTQVPKNDLKENMEHVEARMMDILSMHDKRKFRIFFTTIGCIGATGIIFGKEIKNFFTNQTSDIASDALQKENFHKQSEELVLWVINNENVMNAFTKKMVELINDPEIKQSVNVMLQEAVVYALNQDEVLDVINEKLGETVIQLSNQEDIQNELSELFLRIFEDPVFKETVSQRFLEVLKISFVPLYGKFYNKTD